MSNLLYYCLRFCLLVAVMLSSTSYAAMVDKEVTRYSHTKDVNVMGLHGHYKLGKSYTIRGETYTPKIYKEYTEEGYASWYGSDCDSKYTANGELFLRHGLTAAHRTLPIPSIVKVTNLANKKVVVLKVNDRGPFMQTSKRIIDVSKEAANRLGFLNSGEVKVRVELLTRETAALRNTVRTLRVVRGFAMSHANSMKSKAHLLSSDNTFIAAAKSNVLATIRDNFARKHLKRRDGDATLSGGYKFMVLRNGGVTGLGGSGVW